MKITGGGETVHLRRSVYSGSDWMREKVMGPFLSLLDSLASRRHRVG